MLVKPKIVDMLIEIIQNETLSKKARLVDIVITNIEKLTQSLYNGKKPAAKETPIPCLSEASLLIKDHLLKKAHLRKLLIIH